MRASRFLDFLCVLLSASVVGLVWWDQLGATPVLILDRARSEAESGDFVSQFLQSTRTEYVLEEGFVSLDSSPSTRRRLLQLLAGLQQCLAVNTENRRRLAGRDKQPLLACVPQEDGRVQVLPIGDSTVTAELLANEREALEEQRQAVAEAVGRLRCRSHTLPNPLVWLFQSPEPEDSLLEPSPPASPISASAELAASPETSPSAPVGATPAERSDAKPTVPASTGAEPFGEDSGRVELTEIESVNPK